MKKIYIQAFLVWCVYSLFSKWMFIKGVASSTSNIFALVSNFMSGLFFGLIFLYIFSHDDFFKFAKKIEKKVITKEKSLIHHLAHFGRMLSVILVCLLSGPLIGALSAKFLLGKFRYKYILVAIFSGISSVIPIAVTRGIVRLPF